MKTKIQKFIRKANILLFSKNLPKNVVLYFHETNEKELIEIRNIINFFRFMGYKFLTINELSRSLHLQNRTISLTFDDGFTNWLEVANLLSQQKIKGTFFCNSINLTSEELSRFYKNINLKNNIEIMNISQFKVLSKTEHEIGSHTHSHETLSGLKFENFKYEIDKNLEILSKYNEIKSFAIPFGMRRYVTNEQISHLKHNFECIAYGEPGMLFNQKRGLIQRYPWRSEKSFKYNINNISTNTSLFNNLTKRSGLG